MVCSRNYAKHTLIPILEKQYSISVSTMDKPGDELTFLKRTHILKDNMMLIQPHPKHFAQLYEIVGITGKHTKKFAGHAEMDAPHNSKELDSDQATQFRRAVGILVYLMA